MTYSCVPIHLLSLQYTTQVFSGCISSPVREVLVNCSFAFTPTMSGGQAPYAWGLAGGGGHLPPGVALNAATGRLSGSPSVAGAFPLSISITDAAVNSVIVPGPVRVLGGERDRRGYGS
ncbi:MAG: Ig domain-containing protein [Gammaproteobacteria bacterium]|nr:Ig domain-containing protein [Gammaproteobacteria bacterium]